MMRSGDGGAIRRADPRDEGRSTVRATGRMLTSARSGMQGTISVPSSPEARAGWLEDRSVPSSVIAASLE